MGSLNDLSSGLAQKLRHAVGPKSGGAIVAASALAAVAWNEFEHRRVDRADLTAAGIRIERLNDLRGDAERLAEIEQGLVREWGAFGLLGFDSVQEMAAIGGATILVASKVEAGRPRAQAALQSTLVDAGGDAQGLRERYPTFASLTESSVWRRARSHGGDTAVLLQITTFGQEERGVGLGSLLRNAALHILDRHVGWALTTTPIDGSVDALDIDLADPKTFTPAMRFHARGGATASLVLPGYKQPPAEGAGSRHGRDVVVMRYARDDSGAWPAPRPEMRLHASGPLEARFERTARRLAGVPRGGRGALRGLGRRAATASRRALRLRRHKVVTTA